MDKLKVSKFFLIYAVNVPKSAKKRLFEIFMHLNFS